MASKRVAFPARAAMRTQAFCERHWLAVATLLVALLMFGDLFGMLLRQIPVVHALPGILRDACLVVIVIGALPYLRGQLKLLVPLAAVAAAAFVSLYWSLSVGSALKGVHALYLGLLVVPAVAAVARPSQIAQLMRRTVVCGQVAAVVAVVTWRVGLPWLDLVVDKLPTGNYMTSFFVAGSIYPRAFSPFVSPNTLGAAMTVVVLIVALAPGLSLRQRCVGVVAPLLALALSQSRSAAIGLVVGLAVLLLMRRRIGIDLPRPETRLVASVLAADLFLVVLPALLRLVPGLSGGTGIGGTGIGGPAAGTDGSPDLGDIDPSAVGHVASIGESLRLALQHPFGFGLGSVGPRSPVPSPLLVESSFLVVLLEIGIVGLVGYLLFLTVTATTLVRSLDVGAADGRLVLLGLCVLAGSLPSQLLLPSIQETAVAWLWWLVLGGGLAATQRRKVTGNLSQP